MTWYHNSMASDLRSKNRVFNSRLGRYQLVQL